MFLRDFTIEYRKNPIGLDALPRFSWKLESSKKNCMQKKRRICVWRMTGEETCVWDSGEVESDISVLVPYEGEALEPFTGYKVSVTVTDSFGKIADIEGTFETGLLKQENWKAAWITHMFPAKESACPYFSKEILSDARSGAKLVRARLYVTALGIYEAAVDGKRVGDAYLSPGWTSYHNRLQYQTYDITDALLDEVSWENVTQGPQNRLTGVSRKLGKHTLEITLGNGWYKGYLNCDGRNCFYGDRTALLAMILLDYDDGVREVIGTDESWRVRTGVIRDSELYHGEILDFTAPVLEGKVQLFDASEKIKKIVSQECEPVRITEEIKAAKKFVTPRGELVIDFGQNLPGFVRIRLPRLTGRQLVIRHAETLDKDGNFYTQNLRSAKCRDVYIYGNKQEDQEVSPHFTYRGFRYICVEGVEENVEAERFTACVLHTDMKQTGAFSCDNEKINRLQKNIIWGQRSNFVDIPTDCPQRDERLGWTGDAQIFCRTAMFNYQTALFYGKWMRDVAVETDDEHGVPHLVPNITGPATGTAVWSDCATIIPWTSYMVYGDRQLLFEQYPTMCRWVEYIRRSCGQQVLWMNGFQRGDWLALDSDESLHLMSGGTDKNLVANVYYALSVRCVKNAAKVLQKHKDEKKYQKLYEDIVEELNQEYVTANGRLVSETQTACTLLLYFELLKPEYRSRVIRTLEDNLNLHKGHLTTGFVGTAYLCHALSENGKHAMAEELLLNEEYPGWLYAVNMGATTIWERWNSILPNGEFDQSGMNSLNHYTYGSIGDWMYRKIAGINPLEAGYKKIWIRPMLTRGMTRSDASLETMYGTIECHWKCADGRITVDVKIPANTTAVLELPEKEEELELGSGEYHFSYNTKTDLRRGKLTMNSTLKQVLALPGGREIFAAITGNDMDESMRNYLEGKTLSQLAAMMPEGKEVMERLLRQVRERE